jgi:DNA-directed RNA polymerase subunit RPC12/RpoP
MFNKKEVTALNDRILLLEQWIKKLDIHECPNCKFRTLHENRRDKSKDRIGQDPEYFPHSYFCLTCGVRNTKQLSNIWIVE